jgi:hypothetical protein
MDSTSNIIFGSEFYEAESKQEISTTSINWKEKLILKINDIPTGRYRIGWFYNWRISNTQAYFMGSVELDDVQIYLHKKTPMTSNVTQLYSQSGFKYLDLSAGEHTIKILYKTSDCISASYISNARLELWRVK